MLTVAVIPARAGSKGLRGKHLRLIAGRPMVAHTIRAALSARRLDRVIVSTNDPAIARVARREGAEVPFLRPDALATDETPTAPVIEHAIAWLEGTGASVDLVVTLQPTSPLRTAAQIDDAVEALASEPSCSSLASVAPVGIPTSVLGAVVAGRLHRLPTGDDVRRQGADEAVRLTGGVYVTRRPLLASGRLLDDRPLAFLVPADTAVDVDTETDLAAARRALRDGGRRR